MHSSFFLPVLWCLTAAVAGLAGPSLRSAHAAQVEVWLTVIDDGQRKDALHRQAQPAIPYDQKQDASFRLFARQEPLSIKDVPFNHPISIRIDNRKTFQTIKGLGAAMTDSSAYVLFQLREKNPQLYQHTMQRLFSLADGAGFSYMRQPLGASDYTATPGYYTYCDEKSEDLSRFSIAHDREYIVPMLKDALKINPQIEILGSPWSPPAWMKTSERLVGISSREKEGGMTNRLKPQYFDLYADYFVKYLEAYAKEGITIQSISLQNEAQADGQSFPCMRMTAEDQIKLIEKLGPKLKAKGFATKIFVHDHNWIKHPADRQVVGGDVKEEPIEAVKQMLSQESISPYIGGSAWHGYAGTAQDMIRAYEEAHRLFPGKEICFTEITAWGRTRRSAWRGDIESGMQKNWLEDLNRWAAGCLEWNLALDEKYGPTPRSDSAAYGLVTIYTDRYDQVRFEREFYAMAQVSKAAQPGSVRVAVALQAFDAQAMQNISVAAFRLKDGRGSLVVFNDRGEDCRFQVEGDKRYFEYNLPAWSIATFLWN
jgi:glucosylceramidase